LASCNRRGLVGRRDFAILLLLSRLGLRAGEVARLRLDDVDWHRGLLLVQGRGGRYDELPLPDDVGQALVSYLRRRPRCQSWAVFVRVTAPRWELNRSTIGWVVRAACDRDGLPRDVVHVVISSDGRRQWHHGKAKWSTGQPLISAVGASLPSVCRCDPR
jgi:integrase